MLPTPSTDHINVDRVYDPAEDSYLLLDALSAPSETSFLTQRFAKRPTPLLCEVGTGSGIVLAFITANCRAVFGRDDLLSIATDVNSFACSAALETVRVACSDQQPKYGDAGLLDATQADLTTCLRPRSVDVLVFNPPYVPSDHVPLVPTQAETNAGGLDARQCDFTFLALATDGGADGMQVTARLLDQLPTVLTTSGVAYVLLCRRNKPESVRDQVREWDGEGVWTADIVKDSGRKGGIESLCILRIARRLPLSHS